MRLTRHQSHRDDDEDLDDDRKIHVSLATSSLPLTLLLSVRSSQAIDGKKCGTSRVSYDLAYGERGNKPTLVHDLPQT